MNYSLIACDLDGTLLDDYSHVAKESLSAIQQINRSGVEFVLCTGRTYYEIPKELREFSEIRYYLYSDGAVVYDKKEQKVISARYFGTQTLDQVLALLEQYDTMIEAYDDGVPKTDARKLNEASYAHYRIDPNYLDVIRSTRLGLVDFSQTARKLTRTEIINVFFADPAEREDCFAALQGQKDLTFTTSMDNNIEIMLRDVSKGNALLTLAQQLQIPWEQTMAVGDSRNDLSMFAIAGMAVASGSASPDIQQKAGHVACSNNDSIPQYILTHYLKNEGEGVHAR